MLINLYSIVLFISIQVHVQGARCKFISFKLSDMTSRADKYLWEMDIYSAKRLTFLVFGSVSLTVGKTTFRFIVLVV